MKAAFQLSQEIPLLRTAVYELFAVLSNYIATEAELVWTKEKTRMLERNARTLARDGYRLDIKPLLKALDAISDLEEIQADYVGLFDLPQPNHAHSPFESVQRGEGVIMGQRTKEVQDYYREFGLEIADGFKELPDHVVAELAFMSVLCAEEGKALSDEQRLWRYQTGQHDFLSNHIMTWVPELFSKVAKQAQTELYRVFPPLANNFLAQDFAHIRA